MSRRGAPTGRQSSLTIGALAVLAAALAGLAVAALPIAATLVLLGCGGLALLVVSIWVFLRRPAHSEQRGEIGPGAGRRSGALSSGTSSPADTAPESAPEPKDPAGLRLARLLFYVGALTVAMGSWQVEIGGTVSDVAFAASFACCLLAVLQGVPPPRLTALLVAGVGIFVVGAAISSAVAVESGESAMAIVRPVYVMLLLPWTAAMVLRERRHLLVALTVWAFSVAVSGAVAVFDAVSTGTGRQYGLATHPNELGGGAGVVLAPALMLAISVPSTSLVIELARWMLVALIGATLVLAGSVAGMAGAVLGVTIWLSAPTIRGVGRVAVIIALLASFTVASVLGGATPPAERVEEVISAPGTSPNSGSGSFRLATVEAAWDRIETDPFVGQGLAAPARGVAIISGARTGVADVHSGPVAAWYQAGIFGLVGILLVVGSLIAAGWRAASMADERSQRLGWSVMGAVCGYAVIASAGPLFFESYGWIAAAMLVAWWRITTARHRAEPPASHGTMPDHARRIQPLTT